MTNREKYITKRDEYDLMMAIKEKALRCPIIAVGGSTPKIYCDWYGYNCSECIQKWLNQEADQSRPQWQDAMMKNFLRR